MSRPPYKLIAGPDARQPVQVTALAVRKALRFGNSMRQVSNVFAVAEERKIPTVYLPEIWWLKKGVFSLANGITVVNERGRIYGDEQYLLFGEFYFLHDLDTQVSDAWTEADRIGRFSDFVNLDLDATGLEVSDLVIHLRSGDIFSHCRIHQGYGQPPLGFYLKILEDGDWNSVTIVAEDDSNPVHQHLVRHCFEKGLNFRTVSGDLRSDLELLLRARTLVVGRGTFGSAVAAISRNVETVHYFDSGFEYSDRLKRAVRWTDASGIYRRDMLSDNWTNAPEQQQLMIDYPMASIVIG